MLYQKTQTMTHTNQLPQITERQVEMLIKKGATINFYCGFTIEMNIDGTIKIFECAHRFSF